MVSVLLAVLTACESTAKSAEKKVAVVTTVLSPSANTTIPPLGGRTGAPTTQAAETQTPATLATTDVSTTTPESVTVSTVVDGDTVYVSTGEKIRLIGIDTPERGVCGYHEATDRLRQLVGAKVVALEAGARDDVDKYGRLLRYVIVDGVDAGGVLISEGLAVPRYNSTDGYGGHPKEAEYAAEAQPSPICSAPTTAAPTTRATAPPAISGPSMYYASCDAVRAAGKAPLYKGQPGYRSGLDRDHDGVACE